MNRRTFISACASATAFIGSMLKTCHAAPIEPEGANLLWGTFGKSGREPMSIVRLGDCADDHLQAILDTQSLLVHYRQSILDIQEYRSKNGLTVKETFVDQKKINRLVDDSILRRFS